MSYRDIEIMVNQGYSEKDARVLDALSDEILGEIYAMGVDSFRICRALRAAFDLGQKCDKP